MSKQGKRGGIPLLRFPEFRGADAWINKKLFEVADVNASGDLDPENFSPIKTDRHIYPIYSNSVSQEGLYGYCAYPKYQKDSVTITARGTLGVAFSRNHDYVGIGRLLVLSNLKNVVPYFLQTIWNYSAKIPLENGGIPQLTAIKARAVELYIPKKEEQQKIADCLSGIDTLITSQTQKLDALKTHKKGVMQQLFPSEGEVAPKRRFPEFLDKGEWITKTLGDCLLRHPDYGINAPSVPYSENLPTYIRITDISADGYFLQDQKVSVSKAITSENYLNNGDIVLARTGASVGKSYKYRPSDGKLVFAGFLIRVTPDEEKLNLEFLFQFLATEQFWRWVLFTSARSGQPGINGNEYSSLPIKIPSSLNEQQKIADCLTSIDELIATQTQKLVALKSHKKGLMQQLFPTMDGVGT